MTLYPFKQSLKGPPAHAEEGDHLSSNPVELRRNCEQHAGNFKTKCTLIPKKQKKEHKKE